MNENKYSQVENSYDYLLKMPIRSFTQEKISALANKITETSRQVRILTEMTEKEMWLKDLDELERCLK
jgi:hypothetical protein